MSCCKITSVCPSFAAKYWRYFTNALMTLRHYAFSRQHRTQFTEDVYPFVLWHYVAVQIWRVKELFVPGIVASTINKSLNPALHISRRSSEGKTFRLWSKGCWFEPTVHPYFSSSNVRLLAYTSLQVKTHNRMTEAWHIKDTGLRQDSYL